MDYWFNQPEITYECGNYMWGHGRELVYINGIDYGFLNLAGYTIEKPDRIKYLLWDSGSDSKIRIKLKFMCPLDGIMPLLRFLRYDIYGHKIELFVEGRDTSFFRLAEATFNGFCSGDHYQEISFVGLSVTKKQERENKLKRLIDNNEIRMGVEE